MQYINNEIGALITGYGKEANKEAKAGKAVAGKIRDACPKYESLEKPDQESLKSEVRVYLTLALPVAHQTILATKPSELASDSERVLRENLGGTIRSQLSRLLKLAFPKERGHSAKRTIEQYLIDTHKAVIKRCEATDRGDWSEGVRVSYELAKQGLAAIK